MKKILCILFLFLATIIANKGYSQLLVSNTMTPAQLVQNVLVGQGITVSNVTYTGSTNAIASFTTGATPTNIGFPAGIIMASGNATTAIGPNTASGSGTNLNQPGDATLNSQITQTTYDACVLEFDFIPVSDTIKFRYVFASEEYPEFVNSSFNDIFGFFVSGFNPTGPAYANKNIALIPNTATPVSINNVNNGTANAGPCTNCAYYVNNTGGTTIEYDGMTVVLTAWLKVMPCFTYHIKLAIADAGDGILDSGVFLEAKSFMSNSVTVHQSPAKPTIDSIGVEGCNNVNLTFRIPQAKSTNTIINYGISGTAQNGIDYDTIPNQVVIPAGQDSVNLTIIPFLDSIIEGIETIRLVVNTSACTYDTVWIYIRDNSYLETVVSNDTVICNDTAILVANPSGGIQPYSLLWSTGDTISPIFVSPPLTTTYTVIVDDACGQSDTSDILVKVSKPIAITVDDTICAGQTGQVSVSAVGAIAYQWNTGPTTPQITDNPNITTVYNVIVTDTLGCTDTADAVINVNQLPNVFITPIDTAICEGDSAKLTASGGVVYVWNTMQSSQDIMVSPATTSNYSVTAYDQNNCSSSGNATVNVVPQPIAVITPESDTICRGSSTFLTAFGGDTYLWNTGETTTSISVAPKETTTYSVTVSNSLSGTICSDQTSFELAVKRCNAYFVPNAFTPNNDGQNDFFGPIGVFKAIEYYELFIFDRWGKLIYHTNDLNEPWNGLVNNTDGMLQQGTYTYKILIKETYNDMFELKGTVTLLN